MDDGVGLDAWGSAEALHVREADQVVTDAGRVRGAVFGPLTDAEAEELVYRLCSLDDPADSAPELPWAAVVRRPDGTLAATASTMLSSGLFWSVDVDARTGQRVLNLATDPGRVVRGRPGPTQMDDVYIRDFAALRTTSTSTPYGGVARIPAGHTAAWRLLDGSLPARLAQWCGPEAWEPATLEGPSAATAYLAAFDAVVRGVAGRASTLVGTVSGGLDSTFMAASIALQTTNSKPLHGFVHAPLPEAALEPRGRWDPDDTPYAQAMAAAYPGRITIEALTNTARVQPLDAALGAATRSWIPTLNPANQVWLDQIWSAARGLDAPFVLVGANGNASFSFDHAYARASAWSQVRRRLGPVKRSVLGALGSPRPAPSRDRYLQAIGVPADRPPSTPTEDGRGRYLRWLADTADGVSAAGNPARDRGVLTVDPFSARTILDLAAAITPREWTRDPDPRGFARRLGAGRVPDEIRLRTRRGGQAWDDWFVMRDQRDRYEDEISLLAETPALGGWIDPQPVRSLCAGLPWGQVQPPETSLPVTALNRILSLAAFARMTRQRLATTHS